ncbi:MAG TPA: dockerin type I domain-containing protein [Clostridia bacterium]|nr:dockerin type I domain-containing protein [Clostridia bacterium]
MKNHRNIFKALTSLMVCLALVCATLGLYAPPAKALDNVIGTKQFTISNPYATVDWDTWGAYKANLHTHSTVSDGKVDFRDMIEAYYSAGYDILAMTDHGTINYGWDVKPDVDVLIGAANIFKKKNPLSTGRKNEIYNGVGRGGRGMTEVPLGIELNGMAIKKTHVNGFYANSGHHVRALDEKDYEPAIKAYEKAGGITHINHIGEWSDASSNASVYDDPSMISYFVNIFNKYPSCLGFELVNKSDSRTKNDRILYDKLLEQIIPTGRNIFGFANDDAHELSHIGKSWEIFMMPVNNAANVRTAMETGTFFAVSKYAKAELGDSFTGTGPTPEVTRITVDNAKGQIALEGENYNKIQWVANGVVIAEGNTIDLNAYESQVTCYVRAQVSGPGGMCFVQPFPVTSAPYQNATVGFTKNPSAVTLVVKNSLGEVIFPSMSGTYDLSIGGYTWSASAEGYIAALNIPFTVDFNDAATGNKTIEVSLRPVPTLEPAPDSTTVINKQTGYIYGLSQGITSLDNFVTTNANSYLDIIPGTNGFGTGTIVNLVSNGQIYESYTIVIKGDANGDGFVDGSDSTIVSLILGGMLPDDPMTVFACDINGNGVLDESDRRNIELAGLFLSEIDQTV